ncbi:MAG: DivIVA domain-containing protein [Nocardioidaceae bacterium]|nr:DivIVA domain-containing protein [Nocardioidaceae bacterium]NUS52453.1 DivIVA domain-containing protein [Nocardioidaceae bacterium]
MTEGSRFTVVRMREGYDIRQVDEFLDQVSAALEFDPPLMGADEVEAKRFAPVRIRHGYDMDEVDTHLDHLAAELRRREPVPLDVSEEEAGVVTETGHRPVTVLLLVLLVLVVAAVVAYVVT